MNLHNTAVLTIHWQRDIVRRETSRVSPSWACRPTSQWRVPRNLADAGFDVYVGADCCTTATQEAHDASIETLGLLTRRIVSADELTAAFASGGTV